MKTTNLPLSLRDLSTESLRKIILENVFVHHDMHTKIAPRGSSVRDPRWFFDFRKIVFNASVLDFIAEDFWNRYGKQYPFQVGGLESASLPLITAIVLKGAQRGSPVHGFFMRKSRKRDGLMEMFEGGLTDDPIILLDDSMNSGQTFNRQILALSEAGKRVSDIFVVLRFRNIHAYEFVHKHDITINSMYTLEDFGLPLLEKTSDVPQDSFEVLWKHSGGDPSFNMVIQKSAPILDKDRVYVGSDNGIFWALDKKTGAPLWKFAIGPHPRWKGIFSSPVTNDGMVYFGAYDGNVYALDADSGRTRWIYAEADWVGSSPALAPRKNLLFIGLEFGLFRKRGGIVALNASTGERMWGHKMPEYTHGSPLYVEKENIVTIGSNDGVLYTYEALRGTPLWTFQSGGPIKASPAYDPRRKLVIFCSWDGKVYALHAQSGKVAFTFQTETPMFSIPLVSGDLVYAASLDKNLYAIDLADGHVVWKFLTHGRIFASPVLVGDSLWIGSNDGRLYELDPVSGTLRSFFQTTERIVNAIAHDKGSNVLFVPTVANELYCIRKRNVQA